MTDTGLALIVLGKNWEYPLGVPPKLSPESQITSIAAAELLYKGKSNYAIFTGGHTAGAQNPSEAETMAQYMREYLGGDGRYLGEDVSVLREEKSLTTSENAVGVRRMLALAGRKIERIGLVSIGFHLPRARRIFERAGVKVDEVFASEEVAYNFGGISPYMRVINYNSSTRKFREGGKETIIGLVDRMPCGPQLLDWMTHRTRR